MEIEIGELKKKLQGLPDSMPVNFGHSRSSKWPQSFYRFKVRGEKLLHIELNEIDPQEEECDSLRKITVGELRKELDAWKNTDYFTFGGSISDMQNQLQSMGCEFCFNFDERYDINQ